jgi:hypothetical protein
LSFDLFFVQVTQITIIAAATTSSSSSSVEHMQSSGELGFLARHFSLLQFRSLPLPGRRFVPLPLSPPVNLCSFFF